MTESFADKVDWQYVARKKRGYPVAAEDHPPSGQAAMWFEEMVYNMPRSAMRVGKQIARLCADDSQVTTPYRSLADAVGVKDKGGRTRAYVERGIKALVECGWLKVETVGQKRGSRTTFYLVVGEPPMSANIFDQSDVLDEDAA